MPKRKHPKDMTTDELAKVVFPKEVREKLKEIAQGRKPQPIVGAKSKAGKVTRE